MIQLFLLLSFWLSLAVAWSPSSWQRRRIHRQKETTNLASSSSAQEDNEVDVKTHLEMLQASLQRADPSASLLEQMNIATQHDEFWTGWAHTSSRFALFTHGLTGSQDLDGPPSTYANFAALSLYQVKGEQFTRIPASRLIPPGMEQEEWFRTMQTLQQEKDGILRNYSGLRWTVANQETFFIQDAWIWNCYDENGEYCGQATLVDRQKVRFI